MHEREISKMFNLLLEPDSNAGQPSLLDPGRSAITAMEVIPPPAEFSRLEHIGRELERLRHVMGKELALISRNVVQERVARANLADSPYPIKPLCTDFDGQATTCAPSLLGSESDAYSSVHADGQSTRTSISSRAEKTTSRTRGLTAREAACKSPLEHMGLLRAVNSRSDP